MVERAVFRCWVGKFLHTRSGWCCATCHRLEDVGHAVGPDLAALTNKTREGLLTAILDPSRDIDQRYAGYMALTTEGKTVTGILVSESSNAVTLKAQENKHE